MAAAPPAIGRQLFVGNLPFIVQWQDLKDLFREVGNVLRADVVTLNGRSRGFGTVLFATPEEAANAITSFNNFEWHGRKIEVREDRAVSGLSNGLSPPQAGLNGAMGSSVSSGPVDSLLGDQGIPIVTARALYVGNLPYAVGWQDLKDLFRQAGNVVRAEVPSDYQGRSKGFGTVLMASVDEARKAVALYNGHEWNGRRIEVREDRTFVEGGSSSSMEPRGVSGGGGGIVGMPAPGIPYSGLSGGNTAGRALFVGNLPFTIQWQELKDLFRQAGNVQRADVVQDSQGRSRGYGQVLMSTVEEAQKAIQLLSGQEVQGRPIEVREDKFANEGVASAPGTQVFVGNLPYSTRWQDLKDLFRPYGLNPVHADIMTEPGTGRSKGWGVVRFLTKEESERAVKEVNGIQVSNRNIVVRMDKFS